MILAASFEQQYKTLLRLILSQNIQRYSRTGETVAAFNCEIDADLSEGFFPILTGRKMYWKNILGEAEWMLSGSTNVNDLHKYDVHIWDKWANAEGELGPTYGAQLKKQWSKTLKLIKADRFTRRAVISLWDADHIDEMSLPPCYHSLQFYVDERNLLCLRVHARSSDAAVGLPYDICVLSYLLVKAAIYTQVPPGKLVFSATDMHINVENIPAVKEYLANAFYTHPLWMTAPVFSNSGCTHFTVELKDYRSNGHIKMVIKE